MQITNPNPNTSYTITSSNPSSTYTEVSKQPSIYDISTLFINSVYAIKRYLFWGSSSDLGALKWESLSSKWDEL